MNTSSNLGPLIIQHFNKKMLMNTLELYNDEYENCILPLAKTKIRLQDIGKRKEFEELTIKYKELYERKTKEEDEYQRKVKEKIAQRPCLHAQKTMRFSRFLQIKE